MAPSSTDVGPRPLKSALKLPRFPGPEDETPAEAAAPTGKRVRIRSINNVVHVFSTGSREATPDADAEPSTTSRVLQFGSFAPGGDPREDGGGSPLEDLTRSHRARVARQRRRRGKSPAAALAATLAWMMASSALIFLNKDIMVDRGWGFPFALTAIGQFSSAAAGAMLMAGSGVSGMGWVAGLLLRDMGQRHAGKKPGGLPQARACSWRQSQR